jgi:hypothetical protein
MNYDSEWYSDSLCDLEFSEDSVFFDFTRASEEQEEGALQAIDDWLKYFESQTKLYERFRERVREAYALRKVRE